MSNVAIPANAALLLVDLQRAVDDPRWGARNNPDAERVAGALLATWRRGGRAVYHVRHDSSEPGSSYRPGQVGNEFKPEVLPAPGEAVVVKHTNSAFVGTELEARLRAAGHQALVVAGVTTNGSVEATVRMAGNLGFATFLVEDATFTFARPDWRGRPRSAQEVHDMALANLDGEYCRVITLADVAAR